MHVVRNNSNKFQITFRSDSQVLGLFIEKL